MIVVEDNEGEIQELLFTDSDLVKATIRRRKNGEDIPCYKLAVAEAGFVYVIGLTMFGVVGSFIGYFIKGLGLL